MPKRKRKQWIAICSFPHPSGTKPYVIRDSDLEEIATFASPDAIEEMSMQHMLAQGVWHAFNFETGELVMIG